MQNLLVLLQCCPNPPQHHSWLGVVKDLSPTIVPIIAVAIAAWLGYKYSLNKLKKETEIALQKELYAKRLEACQNLWKLLVYTTGTENKNAVLRFTRNKSGDDTWYFSKTNAEDYINALAQTFYGMGCGVFITNKEIKDKLFEYRNILYGMLLKETNNTNDIIPIQKTEVKDKLLNIHKSLLQLLKEEVQKQGTYTLPA